MINDKWTASTRNPAINTGALTIMLLINTIKIYR
jgi:hypothetical protein